MFSREVLGVSYERTGMGEKESLCVTCDVSPGSRFRRTGFSHLEVIMNCMTDKDPIFNQFCYLLLDFRE